MLFLLLIILILVVLGHTAKHIFFLLKKDYKNEEIIVKKFLKENKNLESGRLKGA